MEISFANRNEASVFELYRYDYGQVLGIKDLVLPEYFEMHFQNGTGTPITVSGTYDSENEVGIVPIPDECLQQEANSFDAWLWVEDETSGKTLKTVTFYLQQREKPSDIPPVGSVAEIKEYADYVKENAERVSEAVQTANEARQTADELKQLAETLNSAGGLKIFAAADSESVMSFMEKMYADFSANVPVLFMPLFDDEELGMQNGGGMIIIDSGTGQLDDAVIIPMSYSEVPFTDYLNGQLESAALFINSYGYYYTPKPLIIPSTVSNGYVCVNQVNGTAFSDYRPARLSVSLTAPPGQSAYKIGFNSTRVGGLFTVDLSAVVSETAGTKLDIEAELTDRTVLLKAAMVSDKGSSYYSARGSISSNSLSALYLEKNSSITIHYAYGRR